jgi:hypothetical protein
MLNLPKRGFQMTEPGQPVFPHRRNPDGSFDSICRVCFATVARCNTEDELKEMERNHVCDKHLPPRECFMSPDAG